MGLEVLTFVLEILTILSKLSFLFKVSTFLCLRLVETFSIWFTVWYRLYLVTTGWSYFLNRSLTSDAQSSTCLFQSKVWTISSKFWQFILNFEILIVYFLNFLSELKWLLLWGSLNINFCVAFPLYLTLSTNLTCYESWRGTYC